MENIIKFNEWLVKNNYRLDKKDLNEDLINELINENILKLGGRNELNKYIKNLLLNNIMYKGDEKIEEYKNIINEFKKEQKQKQKIPKNEINERIIEVDKSLDTSCLKYLQDIENVKRDILYKLFGDPIKDDSYIWKIRICKNIYILKFLEPNEELQLEIYGKKIVKRDIKMIVDYITKEREIIERIKEEKNDKPNEKTQKKRGEKRVVKKDNTKESKKGQDINIETNTIKIEEKKDKKDLIEELFGSESEEECYENEQCNCEELDIDDIIIDIDDITISECSEIEMSRLMKAYDDGIKF